MPATDPALHKFFEAKPLLVGKVGAGGVASAVATTIPHTFVGLTDGNAYVVTVNRTNATGTTKNPANQRETFIGKASGTNFINCVRQVEGTAQAWAADTVLEILVTATAWNKLIEGLSVVLNQDGTLKNGLVLTVPQINDASSDHQYIFSVGELSADRNIILPVLSGDDTLVFLSLAQTLVNKTLTAPSMTSPVVSSGDINLSGSNQNIQSGGADPWRTITLIAGVIKPTKTAGCASVTQIEAGTNDIDYDVLDFDQTTQERGYVNFQMPDSYDGGVIQFRFVWTAAGGSASETFELELAGRSFADDEAIDQAMGTFVGVSDALLATGDLHRSAWSGDVTLAGGPAAGEWVHLEVRRDTANDNLAADARLIGVQIRFKQAQYSD